MIPDNFMIHERMVDYVRKFFPINDLCQLQPALCLTNHDIKAVLSQYSMLSSSLLLFSVWFIVVELVRHHRNLLSLVTVECSSSFLRL